MQRISIKKKKKKKSIPNNSNFPHTHYPCHCVSTKLLLTFSANFNFLNASNCLNLLNFLSLLSHPYSHATPMTADYSIYPISSTTGAPSSQPSSPLPSSSLSPPPSFHPSNPPPHPPP